MMGVEGRRSSTRTPILLTIFPTDHSTGLEQLVTTDKLSYHHGIHSHTPLLIAAAMLIRLSPKASRSFPAARLRAGTFHERPVAGWRDLWSNL
jgi:hypothetical protein